MLRRTMPHGRTLEYFPIKWLHLIEKEPLQSQIFEHVFIAKAYLRLEPGSNQLWPNMF